MERILGKCVKKNVQSAVHIVFWVAAMTYVQCFVFCLREQGPRAVTGRWRRVRHRGVGSAPLSARPIPLRPGDPGGVVGGAWGLIARAASRGPCGRGPRTIGQCRPLWTGAMMPFPICRTTRCLPRVSEISFRTKSCGRTSGSCTWRCPTARTWGGWRAWAGSGTGYAPAHAPPRPPSNALSTLHRPFKVHLHTAILPPSEAILLWKGPHWRRADRRVQFIRG